jgi:BlaI family transcriptional regulator, penicillinase repressor
LRVKDIFENNNGMVKSLITKDEFYAEQSKQFVEETFDGSLPKFLAAFTRSKKISDQEIDELQKLINEHKEG